MEELQNERNYSSVSFDDNTNKLNQQNMEVYNTKLKVKVMLTSINLAKMN